MKLPLFFALFQFPEIYRIAEGIKTSGNKFFKSEQYVKANFKYKKALRYLNKLHENENITPEIEQRLLAVEIPCLLNRYWRNTFRLELN